MPTATPTRKRTVRLCRNGDSLALVMTEAKGSRLQVDAYYLSLTADAWIFSKHDLKKYTVRPDHCTCPGHTNHGHKGVICRHRAALIKLIELGKLPAPACSTCHGAGGSQAGDVDGDGTCRGCGQ